MQDINIKTEESCIRVFADVEKINACIKLLSERAKSINNISKILSLAGNESRLKILYLLYKEKQMCVCDLSDVLHISISAVSQHLRKLKDSNLLLEKKIGQTIFYSINEDFLEIILPVFIQINHNRTLKF